MKAQITPNIISKTQYHQLSLILPLEIKRTDSYTQEVEIYPEVHINNLSTLDLAILSTTMYVEKVQITNGVINITLDT